MMNTSTPRGDSRQRILVVEDDLTTAREIGRCLEERGFEVELVASGQEALRRALAGGYDAMTLDRMLPDADGVMIVRSLREAGYDLPVLMISALSDIDEKVRGLKAGGDDYLTKPYHPDELAIRLEVMLRRKEGAQAQSEKILRFGTLELDQVRHVARRAGRLIDLSAAEYRLLLFMMERSRRTLSRAMIFEGVWGYRFDPGTNVIDVHIARLRKKIDAAGEEPLFHTLRNQGYRLGA